MKWKTILLAVNLNTGEQINGIAVEIKKRYKIVRKSKKTVYKNTEIGERHVTWECIPKPIQAKLNL